MALGHARSNAGCNLVDSGLSWIADLPAFLQHLQRWLWLARRRNRFAFVVLSKRSSGAFRGSARRRSQNAECFGRPYAGKRDVLLPSGVMHLDSRDVPERDNESFRAK